MVEHPAFGTDMLFQPEGTKNQPVLLTRFANVFGNVGALRIATAANCELFALSGPRNPYGEAKLGVIQEGAGADVLLSEGDPTQDINVLRDYERNLRVIIKDGTVYKNTLAPRDGTAGRSRCADDGRTSAGLHERPHAMWGNHRRRSGNEWAIFTP